jgi:uncharacterized protein
MSASILAGVAFGALNLAHCAGMCGPLAAVGCRRGGSSSRLALLRYQVGRTLTYVFAGAMAGHFGSAVVLHVPAWTSWAFAALAAAACAYAALRVARPRAPKLLPLRTGPRSERSLHRLLYRLLPNDPLVLGLASIALPCGLLAAALLAAAASGNPERGAAFMGGFASASGAAIFGAGWLVQIAPQRGMVLRGAMAALLIASALVALARPLAAANEEEKRSSSAAQPACHRP